MFAQQIQQADDMIQRLENGGDVTIVDYEAWLKASIYGIRQEFGENSEEFKRWEKVYTDHRKEVEAGRGEGGKTGYAIRTRQYKALLQEFDAIIGMQSRGPNRPAPQRSSPTPEVVVRPIPRQKSNSAVAIYVVIIFLLLGSIIYTALIEEWFLFGVNIIVLLLIMLAWKLQK